jgi:hypothetical protein
LRNSIIYVISNGFESPKPIVNASKYNSRNAFTRETGCGSTFLLPAIAACTIGHFGPLSEDAGVRGKHLKGALMEGGYAIWMGQPVILRVLAGNMRVPLRGRLMSETNEILRLRIADSWDIDIFKSMVVAVEHDNPVYVVN